MNDTGGFIQGFSKKGSNKRKDLIFFFFLLAVGISGLIWLLNGSDDRNLSDEGTFMKYTDPQEEKRVLEERKLSNNSKPKETFSPVTDNSSDLEEDKISDAELEIEGANEKGEPMNFVMNNYNPEHKYYIDFGDGNTRTFDTDKLSYQYDDTGYFNLKVRVSDGQRSQIIFRKRMNILEPVEVANGALEVDY